MVLWMHRTTCKMLIRQAPFRLVYVQEVVMPMEFLVPILHITEAIGLTKPSVVEQKLQEVLQLQEDCTIHKFHQQVNKARWDVWNDRGIKQNMFKHGDLVFLNNRKFLRHLRKFQMHWMGLYIIQQVVDVIVVQLKNLDLVGRFLQKRKITPKQRERDLQWCLHFRSLDTTCWVISSKCTQTIFYLNIQSTSLLLWGRICRQLFYFQEYDFQVMVKPNRLNVGLYHLSHLTIGEDAWRTIFQKQKQLL